MKKNHWSVWGLVFIGVCILSYQLWNVLEKYTFISTAVHTQARIISVSETEVHKRRRGYVPAYVPEVEFSSSERTYKFFLSQYSTNKDAYRVGEQLAIFYNPSSPSEARENDFRLLWMGEILYSCMGIFFILIGVLAIVFQRGRENKKAFLLEQGEQLIGKVEKVYVPFLFSFSSSSVYKVKASAHYKEKMYYFESHLFFGATVFKVGEPISILIERNNPTKYFIDSNPVVAV